MNKNFNYEESEKSMYKSNNPSMTKITYPKNLTTLLIRCMEFNLLEFGYLEPTREGVEGFRRYFVPEMMELIKNYEKDKHDLINDRVLTEYINQSLFVRNYRGIFRKQ